MSIRSWVLVLASVTWLGCADAASSGPRGGAGDAGENDRDGKDGQDGADGEGTDGVDGVDGVKGAQGPKGDLGKDGDAGADGQDGKDGVDGLNGSDGDDGDAGEDGEDGEDGASCTVRYLGRGVGELVCPDGTTSTLETGFPVQLVAGELRTCALQRDGHIACWGAEHPLAPGPDANKRYERIAAAGGRACAVGIDGALSCWGSYANDAPAITHSLVDVAVDPNGGCVLSSTGKVTCWGFNLPVASRDVAAGSTGLSILDANLFGHQSFGACVVTPEGRPFCWRSQAYSSTLITIADTWKAGRVTQVIYPCALYDDGSADCGATWPSLGTGPFTKLRHRGYDIGLGTGVCTVSKTGARCGNTPVGPSGEVVDVAVGRQHACGLRKNDRVECTSSFDALEQLVSTLPTETGFTEIFSGPGALGACALRADGTAVCFGGLAPYTPPSDSFVEISTALNFACGRKADGSVVCWGADAYWSALPTNVTTRTFASISALDNVMCGAMTGSLEDGVVRCFGPSTTYALTPPMGKKYVKVVGGYNDTLCMVDDESRLACRIHDTFRTSPAPHGQIVDGVWAGMEGICAKPSGGTLTCDAPHSFAVRVPQDTAFAQISFGRAEACGRYADGSLACWGAEYSGVRHAPYEQTFTRIAVGGSFACGLVTGGKVTCWGGYDFGQARPPVQLR